MSNFNEKIAILKKNHTVKKENIVQETPVNNPTVYPTQLIAHGTNNGLIVTNNATIGGSLLVSDVLTTNDLNVTNHAVFGGSIIAQTSNISTDVEIGGELKVSGNIRVTNLTSEKINVGGFDIIQNIVLTDSTINSLNLANLYPNGLILIIKNNTGNSLTVSYDKNETLQGTLNDNDAKVFLQNGQNTYTLINA